MSEESIRIMVTGTRAGLSEDEMAFVGKGLTRCVQPHVQAKRPVTWVLGDCPTGVDEFAYAYAAHLGHYVEVHSADWAKHGRAAGPMRNQAMVDAGADYCLAFPQGESRGTRDCVKRAQKAGIPTFINELSS